MARKRKLVSKSSEPQKQQKQEQPQFELPDEEVEDQEPIDEEEEDGDEYEEEVEEDGEEEEEEEDEDEEDEDDDNEEVHPTANANNPSVKTSSASAATTSAANRDVNDTDEPIQKLLEPFSKEQLVSILREAADKHSDVADRIRKIADGDPAHRKIFVHGLGWDTTAETLISVFKQYGEIEDCKAVCDKISGKSKGYGFILFKTRSGAQKALKQPQKKIGNRMTACQLASIGPVPAPSAAVAPAVQTQPALEYTLKKIYVSNVGAELDPQKLFTFFSKYGEIEEGPLGLDKMTGKPKGFCLFVYKTADSVKKALEEPHKNFEGHILHCQKAIDGPKPGKSQHHHNNPHNTHFQRNENTNFAASAAGPAHLMAPSGPAVAGIPYNQGAAAAAAAQALNPALGQALTALLASHGAGLGLTNLIGTLGTASQVVPGTGHGIQGGYGNQGVGSNISPGVMGSYGTQAGLQAAYPNQQMGQGGAGRSQHGVGHMGGAAPYMGH